VVKVILQKGRITAAHERYNGIRQVAPMCTTSNTCFPGPVRIQNPNGISNGSGILYSSRQSVDGHARTHPFL